MPISNREAQIYRRKFFMVKPYWFSTLANDAYKNTKH